MPQLDFSFGDAFFARQCVPQARHEEEADHLLPKSSASPGAHPSLCAAGMYLAVKQFEKQELPGGAGELLWPADHQADASKRLALPLGAAECSRVLRQTDRAAKEYQWVAEHAPDSARAARRALSGSVTFTSTVFSTTRLGRLRGGLAAVRERGRPASRLIHINRAEALYGLGQCEQAAAAYKEFLEQFPAHPAGWRAAYRLGELGATARPPRPANPMRLAMVSGDGQSLSIQSRRDAGATAADALRGPRGLHARRRPTGFSRAKPRSSTARARWRWSVTRTSGRSSRVRADDPGPARGGRGHGDRGAPAGAAREARRWLGRLLVFNFRKSVVELLEAGAEARGADLLPEQLRHRAVDRGNRGPRITCSSCRRRLPTWDLGKVGAGRSARSSKKRAKLMSRPAESSRPRVRRARRRPGREAGGAERAFTRLKRFGSATA